MLHHLNVIISRTKNTLSHLKRKREISKFRIAESEMKFSFIQVPENKILFIVVTCRWPRALHSIISHKNSPRMSTIITDNSFTRFLKHFAEKCFYFSRERFQRAISGTCTRDCFRMAAEWLTIGFSRAKFLFRQERKFYFSFLRQSLFSVSSMGVLKYAHVQFHSKYWWLLVDNNLRFSI